VRAADMHARIHNSYNLPYDPAPGSIMDKAMKLWRKKQARRQAIPAWGGGGGACYARLCVCVCVFGWWWRGRCQRVVFPC
jgi:hypothetical protein